MMIKIFLLTLFISTQAYGETLTIIQSLSNEIIVTKQTDHIEAKEIVAGKVKTSRKMNQGEHNRIQSKLLRIVLSRESKKKNEKCPGNYLRINLVSLKEKTLICAEDSKAFYEAKGISAQFVKVLKIQ